MSLPANARPNRVFITGMGVNSPMGNDAAAHVRAIREGSTHFREVDFFDVSKQRVKTAGVADLGESQPHYQLTSREAARMDRGTRLVLHATAQAFETAGLDEVYPETPFVIGTSAGAMPLGEDFYKAATAAIQDRRGQFSRVEHYQPQRQASTVQRALGFRG